MNDRLLTGPCDEILQAHIDVKILEMLFMSCQMIGCSAFK